MLLYLSWQSATDNLKEATDAESYNGLRNIGKKFIQQEKKVNSNFQAMSDL